ncbi:putative phage portal protein [Gordonia effusa NBRC 100432]|uniref:Putative phage portal protein n=1 Tax=Gordonia effusa NBRC 100432 TaxID=1077974 RepID=H0QZ57_9ACTN|nr:phage portal protein [Gordonia effusa]GAB18108.1 putative phage portal protein [Gordonia effusa NBRC 100432]
MDDEPLVTEAVSVLGKSPEQLWREQPYLRTVVTFLARNVAQLGLHTYRRSADGGRERVRDHPLPKLLAAPNEQDTGYDFVFKTVAALALFDRVLIWVIPDDSGQPTQLRVIPERWIVDTEGSTPFAVGAYVLAPDADSEHRITVPTSDVIELHGWNPADTRIGASPVEALKSVLAEQIHAQTFRQQLWENGGRIGSYLTRPKDAPVWSNAGRKRFLAGWRAAYTGNGNKVGGVPVLEDGMELKRIGFSAKDEDYVEGSKLALTTVASVYHVNPTMLGLLDNANYSNVVEFRKGLYGDTLGPIIAQIEARLNADLVARFRDSNLYAEFNIREKLEGSFTEQSEQLASALVSGYMTVNEVRARLNLPALPGGDTLRVPLNMAATQGNSGESHADEAK